MAAEVVLVGLVQYRLARRRLEEPGVHIRLAVVVEEERMAEGLLE